MEQKTSLLKQGDQLAMTRSIKEGEVRVGARWGPPSISSGHQEAKLHQSLEWGLIEDCMPNTWLARPPCPFLALCS